MDEWPPIKSFTMKIDPIKQIDPIKTTDPLKTISAIIPARNEAASIGQVISDLMALKTSTGLPLVQEIVVADNASTDVTAQIAAAAGAKVIYVAEAGYGHACWQAVQASEGDILLFVDGDGAAVATQAHALLSAIHAGADLVIGVRQHIAPQSMSWSQRVGNRFACALVRMIWRVPVTDLGPYRAVRRACFNQLNMQDRHYGWTIEMQILAYAQRFCVQEVPVSWQARVAGQSKISGTLFGVLGAARGILGMIAKLWWRGYVQSPKINLVKINPPKINPTKTKRSFIC